MKVLIVEDEPLLASTLAVGLRAEGFVVVHAANGSRRAVAGDRGRVRRHRARHHAAGPQRLRGAAAACAPADVWTPVLMLTAKDGEYDQTDAFDLGADDYLTKPFSFIVLVARLRALVRRVAPQRPAVLDRGVAVAGSVPPGGRAATTRTISLTPREYGLLEYLMRNKDTVVTKTEILQNVWDAHYDGRRQRRRGVRRLRAAQDRHSVRHQDDRDRPRRRLPARVRQRCAERPAAEPSPRPGADAGRRSSRVPPCAATISRTMASPSPVPPALLDRSGSSRTKRSKTRSRSAGGMPGPSSVDLEPDARRRRCAP